MYLPNHKEAWKQRDRSKIEDGTKDSLHSGDDETSMDDKLGQGSRTFIAAKRKKNYNSWFSYLPQPGNNCRK